MELKTMDLRIASSALAGLLFGLGLAISGMTEPDKVLGFLDLGGAWDPSLALVMGAALAIGLPGFRWAMRHPRAACGDPLQLPTRREIDAPLVIGAILFGAGWGLAGYCPGPALANLARLNPELVAFLPAMAAGSWLGARLTR
jgi:uncharacterized membrane protein YedE/YeeE